MALRAVYTIIYYRGSNHHEVHGFDAFLLAQTLAFAAAANPGVSHADVGFFVKKEKRDPPRWVTLNSFSLNEPRGVIVESRFYRSVLDCIELLPVDQCESDDDPDDR